MKKIFLLFILIILSGCQVTADIKINNDATVNEDINVTFDNSSAMNYASPEEYAYDFLDYYNSAINSKKYNYKFQGGNKESKVTFYKKNNNICDFIKYNLFSQFLYKNVECIEDEYYFIIKSEGNQFVSKPQNEKLFNLEYLTLNITLPVEAEEHNSDLKKNFTYTWNYNQETDYKKSIYLKVSKEELENNKKRVETSKISQQNKKMSSFKLVLVTLILILIGSIVLLLYKKYKNNKLEY